MGKKINDREKREAYERQKGVCPACGQYFEIEDMEADHIMPWSKGGKLLPKIAKCFAKTATDEETAYNNIFLL